MVLNDISDDAILIKVSAPPFRAEVFAEDDLHIADEGAAPKGLEDQVGKPQHLQTGSQTVGKLLPSDLTMSDVHHILLGWRMWSQTSAEKDVDAAVTNKKQCSKLQLTVVATAHMLINGVSNGRHHLLPVNR